MALWPQAELLPASPAPPRHRTLRRARQPSPQATRRPPRRRRQRPQVPPPRRRRPRPDLPVTRARTWAASLALARTRVRPTKAALQQAPPPSSHGPSEANGEPPGRTPHTVREDSVPIVATSPKLSRSVVIRQAARVSASAGSGATVSGVSVPWIGLTLSAPIPSAAYTLRSISPAIAGFSSR